MKKFIGYGRQSIDESDIDAVVRVLKGDFLTQGPAVAEFERAVCNYTGAKYCVAVSNGTAALHIAVAALELNKGDEGITSPITFLASSNCMVYNDIKPVFADIELETANIDIKEIENKTNENTKLIIPVHFAGRAVDMKAISFFARDKELKTIEDAAHAIGSEYSDGSKVGNCKYSDMTVLSFHPVKTITTGEGGAITTNNEELYKKLISLRSHGVTKDPECLEENPGPWYYEMHDLGFNYRMTDIQAALGISQIRKLDAYKEKRQQIFDKYCKAFEKLSWLETPIAPAVETCFHLFACRFNFKVLGYSRAEVMEKLEEKGVGTQVHYIPVYKQPFYKRNFGYLCGDYPLAEQYYDQALSLPLFASMTDDEVETVIDAVISLGEII